MHFLCFPFLTHCCFSLFFLFSDHCHCWYHGDCVNVPIHLAQRLSEYMCPKCCLKSNHTQYQFGTVNFRHGRPTKDQCMALLEWLDQGVENICPGWSELLVIPHTRALRAILAHIESFKVHLDPWLRAIHALNFDPYYVSPLLTDPLQLSHLKGCIRQGKKFGINFPELATLKRGYDMARARTNINHTIDATNNNNNNNSVQQMMAAQANVANHPLCTFDPSSGDGLSSMSAPSGLHVNMQASLAPPMAPPMPPPFFMLQAANTIPMPININALNMQMYAPTQQPILTNTPMPQSHPPQPQSMPMPMAMPPPPPRAAAAKMTAEVIEID